MLKWSKHKGKKPERKASKHNTALSADIGNDEMQNNDSYSSKDKIKGSDIKITQNMAEKESALAEARRRFSAQMSNDSPVVASPNISSDPPEIRVDSFDVKRRPMSLNYQSPYTSQNSDDISIASSISLSPTGNSKGNTIERTPKGSRISVPESSHSNTSTLERGGAKSKYLLLLLLVNVFVSHVKC